MLVESRCGARALGRTELTWWGVLHYGSDACTAREQRRRGPGSFLAYQRGSGSVREVSELELPEELLSCAVWSAGTVFAMPWALASAPVCSPH